MFTNDWTVGSENGDGSLSVADYWQYQVQMDIKGAIIHILQRRLGVNSNCIFAVGDSTGDIGIFEEAAHAICFNPLDERPIPYANEVI